MLRAFKASMGLDKIDKYAFESLVFSNKELQENDLLAELLSILLRNQTRFTHLLFILFNLTFIMMAEFIPNLTLFVGLFDFVVILNVWKIKIEENKNKIRSKLGIKSTASIYFNQSPDMYKLAVPKRQKLKEFS
jgi:hypothetical protein